MNRVLAIGDLHGGVEALKQVLERAKITPNDELIFLGDYTDGWGTSFELVEYLIDLNSKQDCVFLKGNHDVWAEEYLATGIEPILGFNTTWTERGGGSTMTSYKDKSLELRDKHFKFFRGLHLSYVDLKNRLFVHGGYKTLDGVKGSTADELMWDRDLLDIANTHSRKFRKDPKGYETNFPKILKVYNEIYIGHTTTQHYGTIQPMQVCNLINLDTGCGHTHGVLTIMDVDTKEYWQSDRLRTLYKDDEHNNFMSHLGANFK